MPRLPDRFDLWVRKARECPDPIRHADLILGALVALKEWHFLNLGTREQPQAAKTTIEDETYLLVFSDIARIEAALGNQRPASNSPAPVISVDAAVGLAWTIECRVGLFVNPPEDAALLPLDQLTAFHAEWKARGGHQASGFWIPNLTSEEEDFWQQHGY